MSEIGNPHSARSRWLSRGWRLIECAAIVPIGIVLFSFGARFHWSLDLLTHFRAQYAIGLLPFVIVFALGKRRPALIVAGSAFALNVAFILPLYFGGPNVLKFTTAPTRAMSMNVFWHNTRYAQAVKAIHDADPDILALQEVTEATLDRMKTTLQAYPFVVSKPQDDAYGIALYSKLPLSNPSIVTLGNVDVPVITAHIDTPAGGYSIVAVHTIPPVRALGASRRNSMLESLPPLIKSLPQPVIVLGDLNCTPWSPHFRELLASARLKDSENGFGVQPTWPSHTTWQRIPIDHFLHSDGITIFHRRVGEWTGSDHFPLIVSFLSTPDT
jgi:endonuclease/exonuclease/phosphatase (EEP) superfamily protein YafD